MSTDNKNQRLNGFNPLSYVGQNPSQPTNFTTSTSNPTSDDSRGFNLGDWWLNTSTQTIWYLAASNGLTATWIQVPGSGTGLLSMKGNSGGTVFPLAENINVKGDGSTVSVAGNPGTSTLTMSLTGTNPGTLTGNSGGPVGPTAGNINIVGSGVISVAGNPGTSTLTINQSGTVAQSFVTQSGTAVPVANVLNVFGSNNISTSGAASTVTVTASGSIAKSYITSPATGTAVPAAGVVTLAGAGSTTVSASGSTITISNTTTPPVSYSEGTFSPVITAQGVPAGTYAAPPDGYYVQIGNLVFIRVFFFNVLTVSGTSYGVGGLPFRVGTLTGLSNIPGASVQPRANFVSSGLGNVSAWWGEFVPGTTYLNLVRITNGGTANIIQPANCTRPGWSFSLTGFYFID